MTHRETFEKEWDECKERGTALDSVFIYIYPNKSDNTFVAWLTQELKTANQLFEAADIEVERLEKKLEASDKRISFLEGSLNLVKIDSKTDLEDRQERVSEANAQIDDLELEIKAVESKLEASEGLLDDTRRFLNTDDNYQNELREKIDNHLKEKG